MKKPNNININDLVVGNIYYVIYTYYDSCGLRTNIAQGEYYVDGGHNKFKLIEPVDKMINKIEDSHIFSSYDDAMYGIEYEVRISSGKWRRN